MVAQPGTIVPVRTSLISSREFRGIHSLAMRSCHADGRPNPHECQLRARNGVRGNHRTSRAPWDHIFPNRLRASRQRGKGLRRSSSCAMFWVAWLTAGKCLCRVRP